MEEQHNATFPICIYMYFPYVSATFQSAGILKSLFLLIQYIFLQIIEFISQQPPAMMNMPNSGE